MAERPMRIQHKRTKGWKMPPNTVDCTRPGPWGKLRRWHFWRVESLDGKELINIEFESYEEAEEVRKSLSRRRSFVVRRFSVRECEKVSP